MPNDPSATKAAASTRALDRGLMLLSSLARHPDGLSAPELAGLTDLSRATVYRLLVTMESRQFVKINEETRKYYLGRAIDPFSSQPTTLSLASTASPQLRELCEQVDESVGLHIRVGQQRVLVDKVEPRHQHVRYVIPTGTPHPLATGATGVVLTMGLSEDEIRGAITSARGSGGMNVPLTLEELARQHAAVKARGFCETETTNVPDLASVAGPIFVGDRVLAAIAVSGPTTRFGLRGRMAAGVLLADAASRISAALAPA